jgi:hypothetical protein
MLNNADWRTDQLRKLLALDNDDWQDNQSQKLLTTKRL